MELILNHCAAATGEPREGISLTADVLLTSRRSETCLDVRKTKSEVGSASSSLELHHSNTTCPSPPVFWPCDKCFKLVLIMRVTEEEMEASADRQDEWSIYFGWLP